MPLLKKILLGNLGKDKVKNLCLTHTYKNKAINKCGLNVNNQLVSSILAWLYSLILLRALFRLFEVEVALH
jgi:hypothetical protein